MCKSLIKVNITGDSDTFSVNTTVAEDQLMLMKNSASNYSISWLKHMVMDDAVRLAEALRILFDDAGVPYKNAHYVRIQYLKDKDDFFVYCLGLDDNSDVLGADYDRRIEFLKKVLMHQSDVTLSYLRKCFDNKERE